VGGQVIIRSEAHGHLVVTFAPYFTVEKLATLQSKPIVKMSLFSGSCTDTALKQFKFKLLDGSCAFHITENKDVFLKFS
jgi:hypothetical protein